MGRTALIPGAGPADRTFVATPGTTAAALDELLRADPDAVVAALHPEGFLVAVPASVPLHGQAAFPGRSGLDLVVPADQVALLDGWSRAHREPIVRLDVHLLSDPGELSSVTFFDVRAEHGVHVLVVQNAGIDAVAAAEARRDAQRRRTAHTIKDASAVFREVDAATTELVGWSRDELVGHSSVEFCHPDDVERALEAWMAMRAGTGTGRARLRFRHKAGHHLWVEVTNHNQLDDPDVGAVVSEMVDITDEMHQLENLRERERLLARLAEALPIGVCHLHTDRSVVYTNEPLVSLLGPVDSVATLLASIAPIDRHVVDVGIENALRGRSGSVEVAVGGRGDQRRCDLTFRPLTADDGSVDGVIVCAADVTDRSRLRAELEHRATHDALTGCLNRAAMVVALERELRDSPHVAVAFIDLDQFKVVNDELGHAAGDELLRVAAARLRRVVRPHDQLGRLGGDEFVVICSDREGPFDEAALVARLSDAINGDVVFARQRIPLNASVGVAVAQPGETDAEALLHRADTAMYRRKNEVRG